MSVYTIDPTINNSQLTQTEADLYGSSRIGIFNINRDVHRNRIIYFSNNINTFTRGNKFFELTNHLGNVLATISDKKLQIQNPNNLGQVLAYTADIIGANDYYPFGMAMPGRQFTQVNNGNYRYGFNGKEQDKDMDGNNYDYGMRIYNPQIARFLSVDPVAAKYSMLSPYQFAANRPIQGIDLDGLEFLPFQSSMYRLADSHWFNSLTGTLNYCTVLSVVYENVPTQLQDPQTCGFKFISTGPINDDGTDYDPVRDGAIFTPEAKYWKKGAEFYNLPAAADPEPTSSTKGMGGGAVKQERSEEADAAGGVFGESGAGAVMNVWNYATPWSEQAGLSKEGDLHSGFKGAVNIVDKYVNNGIINGKFGDISINAKQRAGLINFVADGSLNYDNTKESMGAALETAYYGVQLITRAQTDKGTKGEIRDETKQAITDLITKFKSAGGGNEYENISQFYDGNTSSSNNSGKTP